MMVSAAASGQSGAAWQPAAQAQTGIVAVNFTRTWIASIIFGDNRDRESGYMTENKP